MATKLYLCRVELEFVVAAPDESEAGDTALEAMFEEIDDAQPRVVREITSASELGHWRHETPYGGDVECEDILNGLAEDEEG